MHLSQQALSAHIRQLEDELGVGLFQRTTRSVELTTAGQTLNRHAAMLLGRLDLALRETQMSATRPTGQVRLGHVPVVGQRAMEALSGAVLSRFEAVEIISYECWMLEAITAVREGRLDLAVVTMAGSEPDLGSTTIRREPLGVVIGESHPCSEAAAIRPAALQASTLITTPREISPGLYDRVFEIFPAHARRSRRRELRTLTHRMFADDESARRVILGGRGFFLMPEPDGSELPRWATWRPLEPTVEINVDLVWRVPVGPGPVQVVTALAEEIHDQISQADIPGSIQHEAL